MAKTVAGGSKPNIRSLITHRIEGFEDAEEAFAIAGRPKDGKGAMVIKVVVRNRDK